MRCRELEVGLAFLELICLDEWKKRAPAGGLTQADLDRVHIGTPKPYWRNCGLWGQKEYNIGKVFFSWVVGKLVIND